MPFGWSAEEIVEDTLLENVQRRERGDVFVSPTDCNGGAMCTTDEVNRTALARRIVERLSDAGLLVRP